jgi:hypothetical protein
MDFEQDCGLVFTEISKFQIFGIFLKILKRNTRKHEKISRKRHFYRENP